jgi:hypothetical protein
MIGRLAPGANVDAARPCRERLDLRGRHHCNSRERLVVHDKRTRQRRHRLLGGCGRLRGGGSRSRRGDTWPGTLHRARRGHHETGKLDLSFGDTAPQAAKAKHGSAA